MMPTSQVLIDPKTRKTWGVKLVHNGKTLVVKAKKEVIVSSGAVNTPQILMLSGVGPKKHLADLDVSYKFSKSTDTF